MTNLKQTENVDVKKIKKLRNNEYYDTQRVFNALYAKSIKGENFYKLFEIITSEENIRLAFRNLKTNKGSKTAGVDNKTIDNIRNMDTDYICELVKRRLTNYKPKAVRRKMIPKPNGKLRPLGIPVIMDRLIQQCIVQVLEPIFEAKFHPHSYGFRPNRSTTHALARCQYLVNSTKLHYCVDIDIRSFFDNVDHGKLLKQMWTLGIKDKRLLSIISRILKSEIEGEGTPTKGTPQGGIISPILSNIVLNELDWWLSNQWETYKTHKNYCQSTNRFRHLKASNLKQFYHVRYADDFKIFCKDRETADRIFASCKQWLQDRLKLDISDEKSKIVNLRKRSSEFLGLSLKAELKRKKYVCISKVSEKSINNMVIKLEQRINNISKKQKLYDVNRLNSMILGYHMYYRSATRATQAFAKIAPKLNNNILYRCKDFTGTSGRTNKAFEKYYGGSKAKTLAIHGVRIYPIHYVTHKVNLCFNQEICNYTVKGRRLIHDRVKVISEYTIVELLKSPLTGKSIEYNDNRISKFIGQQGKCAVTKEYLDIHDMDCHHINPISNGGDDSYVNLVLVRREIHKLIHANNMETIVLLLENLKLNAKNIKNVNKYRHELGKEIISI